MSRIARWVALSVLSVFLVGPLFSQSTPELVALDTLLVNPQPFAGKTIALYGSVDKSEGTTGFTLTRAQNSGATEKSAHSQLQATWMKGASVVSMQKGQEAIVIGQAQMQGNTPILHVANVITDKGAIRRFIRPSERTPRPGDNLGHDAQPGRSISD